MSGKRGYGEGSGSSEAALPVAGLAASVGDGDDEQVVDPHEVDESVSETVEASRPRFPCPGNERAGFRRLADQSSDAVGLDEELGSEARLAVVVPLGRAGEL